MSNPTKEELITQKLELQISLIAANKKISDAVIELSARWHRHAFNSDPTQLGMCIGWCQAISLLVGIPNSAVLTILKSDHALMEKEKRNEHT